MFPSFALQKKCIIDTRRWKMELQYQISDWIKVSFVFYTMNAHAAYDHQTFMWMQVFFNMCQVTKSCSRKFAWSCTKQLAAETKYCIGCVGVLAIVSQSFHCL